MDKKILTKSALGLAAALILTSGVLAARAATNDNSGVGQVKQVKPAWEAKGQNSANLSAADREKLLANREEHRQEQEVRRQAVEAALKAKDYQAWVAAVGADSPLAAKVTAANFPRFIEAHELMTKGRAIMAELGLEQPGRGLGFGLGQGQGRGHGFMMER